MLCRNCSKQLSHEFINLGFSPPSNSFLKKEENLVKEEKYPLTVYVCESCYLVQLDEFKKATDIFSDEYVYFSSFSTSWLKHSENYVNHIINDFKLDSTNLAVEIASNDGYLLQYFVKNNIPVLGIEPTINTAKVAESKGIPCINEFFGVELANKLKSQNFNPDLILGNNVLAHVPDILDFTKGLKILLKEDGFITFEFPHLVKLIESVQFDTVYHEHFCYLSLHAIEIIFNKCGLRIFDVKELSTHGGSIRIYASHDSNLAINKYPDKTGLFQVRKLEKSFGINEINSYLSFQTKVEFIKNNFLNFINELKSQNKTIIGYGAAAKGNTFLNYCNLKSDSISFVVDANPFKQNKLLPGSHIPVYNESEIRNFKPDYVLILPWNIKNEIIEQLSYIREWGGKFVVCIPQLDII